MEAAHPGYVEPLFLLTHPPANGLDLFEVEHFHYWCRFL